MNTSRESRDRSSARAEGWLADHGDALYRYALQRVRDSHVAEDLVQETLVGALGAVADYAGRSVERTWLIGILKHKVIDHIRRSLRQKALTEPLSYGDDDYFDKHGNWKDRVTQWRSNPLETGDAAEFRDVLDSCLSKLPARTAQVFWLHEAESISSKDLCKDLGISATNLWTMLHRARVSLRRCLSVHWFEAGGQ